MEDDALAALRDALHRQDWPAAAEAGEVLTVDSPGLEADLADLRAEAAWWLGRLDECIEHRERAFLGFDELGDARRAARCAVGLWEHHGMRGHPAISSGWLRRARRALADEPECPELGALLLREAEAAHGGGDLDHATALATRVVGLARSLRSADLEAEALQTIGRILIDRGEVAEGMGHLDEAMLFAMEGRLSPYSTGKVYCSLISACELLGDLDRAAEWTEATLRWAERHPFAIFPGICRVHRAVVLKRRGSLADAEREAARACEELLGSHLGNSAVAYAEVGDICRRLGDLGRAQEAFERAQELSGSPCGGLALLRLAQGRVDAALSIVTGCVRGQTSSPLARAELLPVLVHVAIAADDLEAARAAAAELEAIASTFATPALQASAVATRGRLDLADGKPTAAGTLQEAVDRWHALEVPYEVATARTLLGQALREAGDEVGALAAFASATALFGRIGAHVDARLAAGDSQTSLPAGLTTREVEVLRLIAAGMTNSDIAGELFLSIKTVS
ncbi:MAG: LuxR C-terminal-related transcriptional regulator, partial [Acidimicrobiales bacterium]